jgi:hypothetical protein
MPRWPSILTLALLLAGSACQADLFGPAGGDDDDDSSTPADDDVADDDDSALPDPCEGADPADPCCVDALPAVYLGACDLEPGATITGSFSLWTLGALEFVTEDGQTVEFVLSGTPQSFVLLPDLSSLGTLTLTQTGGCDGESGYYNAVHAVDAAGDMVLLTGSTGVEDLGGWTVASPPDTSCLARPSDGCNEFVHNRPVQVAFGDEHHTLYQGTEAIIAGFDVLITLAQSGSGAYECTDGPGTELDSWVIVPHQE